MQRGHAATLRATWLVARKELVTSFRDRQTTLYAVVLPIVLYPTLFWCAIQGWLVLQAREERTTVQVGLVVQTDTELPPGLTDALARPDTASDLTDAEELPTVNAVDVLGPRPGDPSGAEAWLGQANDEPDHVTPDAVLAFRANGPPRLFWDSTQPQSRMARDRIADRMPDFAERRRADTGAAAGEPPRAFEPYDLERPRDVAARDDMLAYVLSFLLPVLLVLMTVMGAFFPAVDMTAGERERQTSETTLLLPVARGAVHQGKILAVCATAILATALNLLALGLSAGHLINLLQAGAGFEADVPVVAFLAVLPLALLFAFFVSAVLVGVASLARTFKEGQALLGPVQMIFIFPALVGAVPGVELTPGLALVPVVNVVLAFRALLQGRSLPLEYALTAVSLTALAVVAILVAARFLSREALAVGERAVRWNELMTVWRSAGGTR